MAQGPLAYAASHTAAEFIAAHPLWPLWQDTAGTVPACKINDPVGLCLDQGGGGVVLGPVMSITAMAGSNGWTSAGTGGAKVTGGATGSLYGTVSPTANRMYKLTVVVSALSGPLTPQLGNTPSTAITTTGASVRYITPTAGVYFYLDASAATTATVDSVVIQEVIGAHASQTTTTKRPILSGRVNLLTATTTLSTQSITTLAASYKLTFTGSGTVTLSGTYSGSLVGGGSLTFTATAGTLTLTVTGSVTLADLRPANSPTNIPAYQRVTSASDYDTVGFPVRALFDGVDDCLVVPSLDLSITDKVTVVAGVTKLSDAAAGVVLELGATDSSGTFGLFGPVGAASNSFAVEITGVSSTHNQRGYTPYAAPIGAVISARLTSNASDSAGAQAVRLQGVANAGSNQLTSVSTGNLSANQLNIGARNGGASFPFNGAIQSLAVIGNLLPDSEVQILETSANAAMGKVY